MSDFRFDCVFYYVADLDRAIRFYEDMLGFRLSSRDAVARFRVDGVLVELVPTEDPQLLSGQGNARLTLAVRDLDAAVAGLARKAVETSDVHPVSNGRFVTLRDPDGNEVVLWQYS
jgi:catechol 2,3-dioxygenase-like lactoylglutathione lyase family enzyme